MGEAEGNGWMYRKLLRNDTLRRWSGLYRHASVRDFNILSFDTRKTHRVEIRDKYLYVRSNSVNRAAETNGRFVN